jgi:hypothetical protein
MAPKRVGRSDRSLLLKIASAQTLSEVQTSNSSSEFASTISTGVAEEAEAETPAQKVWQAINVDGANLTSESEPCEDGSGKKELSTSVDNETILSPATTRLHNGSIDEPTSMKNSDVTDGELQSQRRWSISERFYPDSANVSTSVQVKDYMPPLYWAGRFQSRFDQWRTEAMMTTLTPGYKPDDNSLLGQCNLDDEKKAAILIFMQLRDLCASAPAADSLHVCTRYR